MFSDDYESIRQHMKQYIETGSTTTPSQGRGQRTSRKNSRFDEFEDEPEFENSKVTPLSGICKLAFPCMAQNNVYFFPYFPGSLGIIHRATSTTQQKTHNLFWPDENRIEQCCAAHIVRGCQQH